MLKKIRLRNNIIYGILLTAFAVLLIFILRNNLWPEKKSTTTDQRKELQELFKQLDSDFWKNPKAGLTLSQKAIKISEEIQDSTFLIRACIKMAGCYQLLDSSDQSLEYYQKALKIANQTANDSLVAKTKNGIANYYLRREQYPEAVRYLNEALISSEKVNYRHVTGLIYNGLGLVNISLSRHDKAILYFQKANRICKEIKDYPNEAGIYLNIANCYAEMKKYSQARQYYLNNLNVLKRLQDTSQIALAYINIGIVDRSLGMMQESFEYLTKSIDLLEKSPNQSLMSTALLETGTSHLENNHLEEARKFLKQSMAISSGTLSKSNSMEALHRLSMLEEKQGRYQQSLEYYKKYTLLKDSVMNDETRNSVAEIQLKYDVQKKVYENDLLGKKYEIKKRQNLILTLVFIFFAIVAILMGLLIWLSHKNLRKSYKLQELENDFLQEKIKTDDKINQLEKLRYESEIEAKNKELTTTSLQLVSKNKILADISRMTQEFYQEKAMDRNSYKGLQLLIEDNLNTDQEWEQFKALFEKVHQNFFTGLKNKYPELTENELRLCAYIRINLQNKEIARILNVSPATITTARYRVRKKLSLDNKDILEDFLRNF